jgi:hypothetical protein
MPRDGLPRVMKQFPNWQKELWQTFERDFWIRETGTDQQVAQLHDRYMMMVMIKEGILPSKSL